MSNTSTKQLDIKWYRNLTQLFLQEYLITRTMSNMRTGTKETQMLEHTKIANTVMNDTAKAIQRRA